MKNFTITSLPLTGLKLITRQCMGDSRGFLSRIFCVEELAAVGWNKPIAQINHTYTAHKGTVRGLHFQQAPHSEMKLVTCIRGKVWDVAIDLRVNSPTFLSWHAEILSAENNLALLIPEGFAHGFQTLTDDMELLYCHSVLYNPNAEAGLNVADPQLEITWPLPISEISERDVNFAMIDTTFEGVSL